MAIQILVLTDDFSPIAGNVVEDFETAQILADAAFRNLPDAVYLELTISDGDEFRIEILTFAEFEEGI